jgi:hypothetical protein
MKSIALFFILLIAATGLMVVSTYHVQADTTGGSYQPLSPLPGTLNPNGDGSTNLSTYIPGLVKLLIAVAGAAAVIMIVIGGVQYLSTDAISGKNDGKERIENAVTGLLLAIGAYIILYTINPATLSLQLSLPMPGATIPAGTTAGTGTTPPATTSTSGTCKQYDTFTKTTLNVPCTCNYCVDITSGAYSAIPKKGGIGTKLNQTLADKLLVFSTGMQGTGWQVTEAWKPTVGHSSSCHINGGCFDASLTSPVTLTIPPLATDIARIKTFFVQAKAAGFSSLQMEVVGSAAQANAFQRLLPGYKVVVAPDNATGSVHFHVNN